jgi:cell division protein FtsZ
VDTLITIPNERLLNVVTTSTSLLDSFKLADQVLQHATKGVSDLITIPGIINVDFADVRTIMHKQGRALMGVGEATDEGRAIAAAQQAINSPLLEDITIEGATGILINVTAGPDLKLHEVEEAASLVQEAAHEECNIIFGAVIDPNMGDTFRITVIATGFDSHAIDAETLEAAMKAHGGMRRQSQAQVVAAGTLGPATRDAGGGGRPTYRHQPRLFNNAQLQRPAAPAPSASASTLRAPVVAPPSASVSTWNREAVADPSEIPAFLRRREEGGIIR